VGEPVSRNKKEKKQISSAAGQSAAVQSRMDKIIIAKADHYFEGAVGNIASIVLSGMFVALGVLEYLAFKERGIFSILASRMWLIYLILFFVLSIKISTKTVIVDIREKNWVSVAMLLYMLFLVFRDCGNTNVINVNYEAAQQVADGIEAFSAHDFKYTELGFLGYPMRQYLALAIPSVLFGRMPFTLHFAFDILMGMGVLLMYSGLRRIFKDVIRIPVMFSSLPLLAVFTSPYIQNFVRVREQVIVPPALMLMAAGWLAIAFIDFSMESVVCSAFAAGFLGSSYTPGLAGAAYAGYVLLFIIVYHIRGKTPGLTGGAYIRRIVVCLGALFYVAMTTYFTIAVLLKISLKTEGVDMDFVMSMLKQIATETPYGLFKYLTPFLLLFGFMTIIGCFSSFELITFLWSAGTVAMAFLVGGYAGGNTSLLSIQRGMVMIPVLAPLFFITLYKYLFKFISSPSRAKTVGFAISALIFAFSASYVINPWIVPNSVAYNGIAGKVNTHVALEIGRIAETFRGAPPTAIYFSDSIWDKNVYDTARYTAPGVPVYATEVEGSGGSIQAFDAENGLIVFAKGNAEIPAFFTERYGSPTVYSVKMGDVYIRFQRLIVHPGG
jgi:hypothetical protein